jgi:hypothetical protein
MKRIATADSITHLSLYLTILYAIVSPQHDSIKKVAMKPSRQCNACSVRLRYGNAAFLVLFLFFLAPIVFAQAPPAAKRELGTVKSVSGNSVVLTLQDGTDSTITFAEGARVVKAVPGQTDLKTAPPIAISDIQVGDRVVAQGTPGEGNALTARVALVMKQGDIAARQEQEREAWRRGVGGIVKQVDAATNRITLNNTFASQGEPLVVHVTPQTEIRRYAANSINFDDAKPSTFDQIRPGDQLRARGTKNSDGTEFTAQAIVAGAFRNIAGTVISADAANNTVTLTDLATKKPMTVKVGSDSQLHKLPEFLAMGIAMRLKGGGMPGGAAAPGAAGGPAAGGGNGAAHQWQGGGGGQGGWQRGQSGAGGTGAGGGFRGNGERPDFQQMLNRMPAVKISELNKGDAVILVATEEPADEPRVITLLTGVEPILSAAPPGTNAAASVLSPWNLGQSAGAGGGGDATPGQ